MSARSASSDLPRRVVTGLIGGAALIALVLHGGIWGARALALVLVLGTTWEFGAMAFRLQDRRTKQVTLMMLGLFVGCLQAWDLFPIYDTAIASFLVLFGVF
ncbi:MAG: hypothetical protein IT285_07655, partial [Bdellovibrionales bacterium]|nr:hypothetical protein [Bdellovibrionales bacterium]